jgi:hypothetical protein
VLRQFARVCVLLAAVHLMGGHWAVLQSVAWVSMVIENVQTNSLPDALSKTFDGAHPCGLCKVVETGKSEEQKQELTKTLVKLDAVLAPALEVPAQLAGEWQFEVADQRRNSRSSAPPTPPPLAV